MKIARMISLLAYYFLMLGSARAGADPASQELLKNAPAWEVDTRASLEKMAATLTDTLKPWPVPDRTFQVEDFGAKADGQTINTSALQQAIDACSAAGGGVVLCGKGDYVTGTIELKSGVMLEVRKGARILGSLHLPDYPAKIPALKFMNRQEKSLIYAENCDHIGIRGEGTIDGRGEQKNFSAKQGELTGRPFLMRIIECRGVVVDGIHLRDSASWMEDYVNCDDLILQGMSVENQANWNEDGFDIDGCHNVIVRKCVVNSYDDGICFKGDGMRAMENVLVEDCTAYSECNALKFGTASNGGFQNVLIRNVKLGETPENLPVFRRRLAESGIAWESVDGGTVENILVTNADIHGADAPIFLRIGDRGNTLPGTAKPAPGQMRRLIFDHIVGGKNGSLGSIIAGMPGATIQDVVIRDMSLSMAGDGKAAHAKIPERSSDYPNPPMFGPEVPAYGFWMRHAEGITFQDVKITPEKPDARPQFGTDEDTSVIQVDGAPLATP